MKHLAAGLALQLQAQLRLRARPLARQWLLCVPLPRRPSLHPPPVPYPCLWALQQQLLPLLARPLQPSPRLLPGRLPRLQPAVLQQHRAKAGRPQREGARAVGQRLQQQLLL